MTWLTNTITQRNASHSLYDLPSALFHGFTWLEIVIQEHVMWVLPILFPSFTLDTVLNILVSFCVFLILILQTLFLLKIFSHPMLFFSTQRYCSEIYLHCYMLLQVNLVYYFWLLYSISSYAYNTFYIPATVVIHSYMPPSLCYPETT